MTHEHLQRRALTTVGTLTAALALTACGGSPGTSTSPVTVTVTPTVTAAGSPGSSSPAAPKAPSSDVVGRRYDFGTVAKVSTVGTTTVLELDRWTWKKLDDAELAEAGVPAEPFTGPEPYTNQNTELTFTVPVADGARVLHHHCVALDQPLQTRSAPVEELADLPEREATVLVQLDDRGRLTSAQNIPGCPG